MSNDLHELLRAASADVPDLDFAQRAWTGAERRRSRTRRRTALAAAAAVVVGLVVGTQLVDHGATPPPAGPAPSVTTSATQTLWRVAPDGTQYAVAPASGTESSLPRVGFPNLDTVDPRSTRRDLLDLVTSDPTWRRDTPVAAFLEAVDAPTAAKATLFQPVFARTDGTLVTTSVRLHLLRDPSGALSAPISVGSLSFPHAAFPQPGNVVMVDLTTAEVTTYPVPSTTIQQVRWVGGGSEKVVASGPDGAWLIDTSVPAPAPERLPDGYTGAADTAIPLAGGLGVTSWELEGLKRTTVKVAAPVDGTAGEMFSTNLTAATGVALDDTIEPVEGARATTGILSVSTYDRARADFSCWGRAPPGRRAAVRSSGSRSRTSPCSPARPRRGCGCCSGSRSPAWSAASSCSGQTP